MFHTTLHYTMRKILYDYHTITSCLSLAACVQINYSAITSKSRDVAYPFN